MAGYINEKIILYYCDIKKFIPILKSQPVIWFWSTDIYKMRYWAKLFMNNMGEILYDIFLLNLWGYHFHLWPLPKILFLLQSCLSTCKMFTTILFSPEIYLFFLLPLHMNHLYFHILYSVFLIYSHLQFFLVFFLLLYLPACIDLPPCVWTLFDKWSTDCWLSGDLNFEERSPKPLSHHTGNF